MACLVTCAGEGDGDEVSSQVAGGMVNKSTRETVEEDLCSIYGECSVFAGGSRGQGRVIQRFHLRA